MKLRYFLPAVVWSLIIVWIISLPPAIIPKTPFLNIPHFDKLVHAFIFAVFIVLLNYGLIRQSSFWTRKYLYTISLVIGVIYGAGTEWIQLHFIAGRTGEWWDFAANITGCLAGTLVFMYLKKQFPALFL